MQTVKIWDVFTRIYHLSQLFLLALLWYSAEQADFELHFNCAFVLLGLWITRIFWGFAGSETSRFTHFIKSPLTLFKTRKTLSFSQPSIGHPPLAGYMVIALLISLGVQFFTGFFATDDVLAEGPLYLLVSESFAEQMDSLHHNNFDILLGLVALHAVAGILHVCKGDNVILAIFTGNKSVAKDIAIPPKLRPSWIALLLWLGLASSILYWGMGLVSY